MRSRPLDLLSDTVLTLERAEIRTDLPSVRSRIRTYHLSDRTVAVDDRSRAAARIVSMRVIAVLLSLSVPLLIGEISGLVGFGVVGLLVGHAFVSSPEAENGTHRDTDDSVTDRGVSEGVAFSVLANGRRRETLRYLRRIGGKTSLRDVAEHIAAKENEVGTRELTSEQRKRTYTTLYQCHLPMMDDAGIVEYDQDRGRVELLEAASDLFEHLDDTPTVDVVNPAFTVGGAIFAFTGLLDSAPIDETSMLWWTLLIATPYLMTTVRRYVDDQ